MTTTADAKGVLPGAVAEMAVAVFLPASVRSDCAAAPVAELIAATPIVAQLHVAEPAVEINVAMPIAA